MHSKNRFLEWPNIFYAQLQKDNHGSVTIQN